MPYKFLFGLFLVAVPWVAVAGNDTLLLCIGTLLQILGLIIILRNNFRYKN